ncbi:ABC transporter substrate-binding protein [Macrococcus sp. EM39E]|uniref:ABC transporter substrate-binding protein n=1 Tax=Macrococcus animalis TaxID=3395467 RepID=UPI0039BE8BF4
MEKILLSLYQLRHKDYSQKELSEILKISQKQLSRKLDIWQFENVLIYESGKGRGNKTKIQWLIDIEAIYYAKVKHLIKTDTLDKVVQYLAWDWSPLQQQILFKKVNPQLGLYKISDHKEKLTITKRYKLFTVHPLEAIEAKSANVVMSVFNRLFTYNENEQLEYNLAHHYELTEQYIDIYLRPNVQFHDGTLLTSVDVKRCLETAKKHHNTQELLAPISTITIINPLSLRIYFNQCPHILALLSFVPLSIYKVSKDKIIGTGPYYIKANNEVKTVLKRFDQYYAHRAFIDTIEMIYIPDYTQTIIGNPENPLTTIEKEMGYYYLCKSVNSQLNADQIQYIRNTLIDHYRYAINKHFKVSLNSPKVLKQSKYIKSKQLLPPIFTSPVMIDCIGKNDIRIQLIKTTLEEHNVPVHLNYIKFDYVMTKTHLFEGDFFCFGEYLEIPESISYYNFIFNPSSSIYNILKAYPWFEPLKKYYLSTPFDKWPRINHLLDRWLHKKGILFPLYNKNIKLKYDSNINGVKINEMGFITFQDIWMK